MALHYDRRAFCMVMRFLAAVAIVCALTAMPSLAGDANDPEVTDPSGDASMRGGPAPPGSEWADIRAAWLTLDDELVMRIQVGAAEGPGPAGELGAHVSFGDSHHYAGWTTVLPPFAVPMYQGGFSCPSDSEGTIDPAGCDTLGDVVMEGDTLVVPLPAGRFGWAPGSSVVIQRAYAAVWYLDVQETIDETDQGRAFPIPAAATGPEPPKAIGAANATADRAGAKEAAEVEPPGVRESSSVPWLVVLLLAGTAFGRLRHRRP